MASNELDSFISGLENTSGASTSGGANPKQEKGQYFMDQNTGQYYFQPGNGEAMAIVPSDEAEANTNPTNSGPSTSDNQVNTGFKLPTGCLIVKRVKLKGSEGKKDQDFFELW